MTAHRLKGSVPLKKMINHKVQEGNEEISQRVLNIPLEISSIFQYKSNLFYALRCILGPAPNPEVLIQ
jgi:hypothetical protein